MSGASTDVADNITVIGIGVTTRPERADDQHRRQDLRRLAGRARHARCRADARRLRDPCDRALPRSGIQRGPGAGPRLHRADRRRPGDHRLHRPLRAFDRNGWSRRPDRRARQMQDLVDCSAVIKGAQISGTTVLQLISDLAAPFGIDANAVGSVGAVQTPQFNVNLGETLVRDHRSRCALGSAAGLRGTRSATWSCPRSARPKRLPDLSRA